MEFAVLGAGGWGTAVARLLARADHDTVLWARRQVQAERIDREQENASYLPHVKLPRQHLTVTASLNCAATRDVLMVAVPSFAVRELCRRVNGLGVHPRAVVSLAKGLDRDAGCTMSEVIADELQMDSVFALSGPSHAEEVGQDVPTAVVLAGRDTELGSELQRALSTPRFRVYLSEDLRGVELCATVKNVIALATGISDGLGYGDNSRAALITRGLAELVRFGRIMEVRTSTLYGLSGLGDLVATCTSQHSRNRRMGERLGQGEQRTDIQEDMCMVAEGVYAAQEVHRLADRHRVEMPITEAVWRILYQGAAAGELVDEIMTRSPKREGSRR